MMANDCRWIGTLSTERHAKIFSRVRRYGITENIGHTPVHIHIVVALAVELILMLVIATCIASRAVLEGLAVARVRIVGVARLAMVLKARIRSSTTAKVIAVYILLLFFFICSSS